MKINGRQDTSYYHHQLLRDEEATEIEINEIRSRILDGEDFSELAKEYSEDPGSASLGGELGLAW